MSALFSMAPGVFVNWIDAGTSPAGISTSIGAWAFHADQGSLIPTSQTSNDTFVAEYGLIPFTTSFGGDVSSAFFRTGQAAITIRSPGEGALYAGQQLANNFLIAPVTAENPSGLVAAGSSVIPLVGSNVDYSTFNRDSWDIIISGEMPLNASIAFSINTQQVTVASNGSHLEFMQDLAVAITSTMQLFPETDAFAFAVPVKRVGFTVPDPDNPATLPQIIRIISPQNISLTIDDIVIEGTSQITAVAMETQWLAFNLVENPGAWGDTVATQFVPLNLNVMSSVQMMTTGMTNPLNTFQCIVNGIMVSVPADSAGNDALLTDVAVAIMANVPGVTASVVTAQGANNNRQIVVTSTVSGATVAITEAQVAPYTESSTVTFSTITTQVTAGGTTTSVTSAVVNWPNHQLAAGDMVSFTVSSGGALPAGITAGTTYFVSLTGLTTNSFELATTQTLAFAGTATVPLASATATGTITATAFEGSAPPDVNITTLQTPFVAPTNFAMNIYQNPNLVTPQVTISANFQTTLASNGTPTNFAYLVNSGPSATSFMRTFVNPLAVANNWTVNSQTDMDLASQEGFMGGGVNGAQSTSADMINAWNLISDPTQWTVRILMNAGYTTIPVQQNMVELCTSRQDCFAILDMNSADQTNDTSTIAARNALNIGSFYAAIYTPDILIFDTSLNLDRYSPPSGYVGAVYALTDATRETWWSPAGLNRGMIPEAEGLRFSYTQGMISNMAGAQINPIINYKNQLIVIWNDWTLYLNTSPLQYIGTVRMIIIIQLTAVQTVAFSLFEPNNQLTRNAVIAESNEILQAIQDGQGITAFDVVDLTQPFQIDARQAYFRYIILPTTSIHQIIIDGIITNAESSFSTFETLSFATTASTNGSTNAAPISTTGTST
jgi:phage tail sheath protein FI